MAHFAHVKNGIVQRVIIADQDFIDAGYVGDPKEWIQTSINTIGNIHYDQNGKPDGGIALRGNFAGPGYIYDKENDVFYQPKPYPSWVLNKDVWLWEAPIPFLFDLIKDLPLGNIEKIWNEQELTWYCKFWPTDISLPESEYKYNKENNEWKKII
jgi:hypothetical protein